MKSLSVFILLLLAILSLQQESGTRPSSARSESNREPPQYLALAGGGGSGGSGRSLACERVVNRNTGNTAYVSASVYCQYKDDLLTGGGCLNIENGYIVNSYPVYSDDDYPYYYCTVRDNNGPPITVTAYAVCCYYY